MVPVLILGDERCADLEEMPDEVLLTGSQPEDPDSTKRTDRVDQADANVLKAAGCSVPTPCRTPAAE